MMERASLTSAYSALRGTHAALELLADFMKRSEGLIGHFERELDVLIERNVGVAPVGLRDQIRETLTSSSSIEHDAALSAMVDDLRTATRR